MKTQQQHTPGPWTVKTDRPQHNSYWHMADIYAGELLVARVECADAQGQGAANCAVLGAAQALLEALEALTDYAADLAALHDERPAALQTARAAIAKARGA